jgi:DNA-binding response OmpR family regulator
VQHVFERHPVRHQIACNGRTVELDSRSIVQPDGQREYLPARDFELLELLITSAPRAVSRNEIIDKLWGEDKLRNQRTVDNMIVHLRQSIGDADSEIIRSVRGVGYQWNVGA